MNLMNLDFGGIMKRLLKLAYFFNVTFLGLLFFTAGMAKLYSEHKFIGIMGPVWLEDELAKYSLGLFAKIIGLSQITAGFLLFTYRFRHLGSLLLSPMIVGILGVVTSMNWKGTPYVVSVFLIQLIYIFWYDRSQYVHLITGIKDASAESNQIRNWKISLLWLMCFLMILFSIPLSYYFLNLAWVIALIASTIASSCNFIEKKWFNENSSI